jgi:hypothetical protein
MLTGDRTAGALAAAEATGADGFGGSAGALHLLASSEAPHGPSEEFSCAAIVALSFRGCLCA